jgi:hypothetical protein
VQQLHKLSIPGARELVAKLDERGLTSLHDVRISGNESHYDDALKKRTQDRSQIGPCAPSHFSDADHAEDESERHEQRSDLVSGVVEIVEHGL